MKRRITRRKFLSRTALATATFPFASSLLNAFSHDSRAADNTDDQTLMLWFDKPANEWTEALPVGNGRLGAMIFGGTAGEQLQLNEDTLYAGAPYDPNNPEALKALPEARRLIFDRKYKEAHDLVGAKMMAQPIKQMPYEPVGDLNLVFVGHENVTDYRRQLDLNTAIAAVSYRVEGVTFTREVFASPVDQVIVVSFGADRPGQLNFSASLSTPQKARISTVGTDTLLMVGENGEAFSIKGGLTFAARVLVLPSGGSSASEKERIVVRNADSAVLLIVAATSYKNYRDTSGKPQAITEEHLRTARRKTVESLRAEHIREHQRLFHRVRFPALSAVIDTKSGDSAVTYVTPSLVVMHINGIAAGLRNTW